MGTSGGTSTTAWKPFLPSLWWTVAMIGAAAIVGTINAAVSGPFAAGVNWDGPLLVLGSPFGVWAPMLLGLPAGAGQALVLRGFFGVTDRRALVWFLLTGLGGALTVPLGLVVGVFVFLVVVTFGGPAPALEPSEWRSAHAALTVWSMYVCAGLLGGWVVGVLQRVALRGLRVLPPEWPVVSSVAGAVLVVSYAGFGVLSGGRTSIDLAFHLVMGAALYGAITGSKLGRVR